MTLSERSLRNTAKSVRALWISYHSRLWLRAWRNVSHKKGRILRPVDNKEPSNAKRRLIVEIGLGALLISVASWFALSGELLHFVTKRPVLAWSALSGFAFLSSLLWLGRKRVVRGGSLASYYRVCKAVAILIFAVLLASWALGGLLPAPAEWCALFAAGVFLLVAYSLSFYRIFSHWS